MPNNIVRTNAAGTVASASVATVNTIAERDNNGDSNFRRVVGNSAVVSSGCLAMLYATKTADYTATDEVNGLISVTVGAANRTVTLPPAATLAGMVVGVKRLDATEFTLTVDGTGSETIDGQASTYVNAQYETAWFLSDGSNWFEVMRTTPWSVAAKSASFSAFGAKPVQHHHRRRRDHRHAPRRGADEGPSPVVQEGGYRGGQRHPHDQRHRDRGWHERPDRAPERRRRPVGRALHRE
jgi:hypothetical protein